ncbi:hypothetical protein GW17_00044379 [Ensete ventricosum]|nr:hypothetical protein GW17_00044379 [Ensete ventricosum]
MSEVEYPSSLTYPTEELCISSLPPLFNMPKSQLQCYGEAVYCIGEDYLNKCAKGKSSLESVEAVIKGKRHLRLLKFGENYEMDSPNLLIKLLPTTGADWVGDVSIRCKDSGLEADLCYYKSHAFLGFGGSSKSIRGKIFHSKTLKTIYEIDGQWDSQAILNKEWGKASAAKKNIEEKQRKLQLERESSGELWVPNHFTVTHTKEDEWNCSPLEQSVPPAPIIVSP